MQNFTKKHLTKKSTPFTQHTISVPNATISHKQFIHNSSLTEISATLNLNWSKKRFVVSWRWNFYHWWFSQMFVLFHTSQQFIKKRWKSSSALNLLQQNVGIKVNHCSIPGKNKHIHRQLYKDGIQNICKVRQLHTLICLTWNLRMYFTKRFPQTIPDLKYDFTLDAGVCSTWHEAATIIFHHTAVCMGAHCG